MSRAALEKQLAYLRREGGAATVDELVNVVEAWLAPEDEKPGRESKPVRAHAKARGSLDGADAQALEHALTIAERERDEATATAEARARIVNDIREALCLEPGRSVVDGVKEQIEAATLAIRKCVAAEADRDAVQRALAEQKKFAEEREISLDDEISKLRGKLREETMRLVLDRDEQSALARDDGGELWSDECERARKERDRFERALKGDRAILVALNKVIGGAGITPSETYVEAVTKILSERDEARGELAKWKESDRTRAESERMLSAHSENLGADLAKVTAERDELRLSHWELERMTNYETLANEVHTLTKQNDRYERALRQIAGWDMISPPDVKVLADGPWLHEIVTAALENRDEDWTRVRRAYSIASIQRGAKELWDQRDKPQEVPHGAAGERPERDEKKEVARAATESVARPVSPVVVSDTPSGTGETSNPPRELWPLQFDCDGTLYDVVKASKDAAEYLASELIANGAFRDGITLRVVGPYVLATPGKTDEERLPNDLATGLPLRIEREGVLRLLATVRAEERAAVAKAIRAHVPDLNASANRAEAMDSLQEALALVAEGGAT